MCANCQRTSLIYLYQASSVQFTGKYMAYISLTIVSLQVADKQATYVPETEKLQNESAGKFTSQPIDK